ncbi:MAG: type II toxin-antitoxin system VapC family toxin [Bryobacteraceae bacterium]|nr:type II toxin-antitoxin system VapC family toxin [Bryobacteraceae bacterium]
MIVLDTNVLSALMQRTPEQPVIEWLDQQPWTSVWTTSITILEIRFGLQTLPLGKRRSYLIDAFERVILQKLGQRVAAFDQAAADEAAVVMANRKKKGRPGDLRDTMIAGIVLAHGATLATRNGQHFADLTLNIVNPWTA